MIKLCDGVMKSCPYNLPAFYSHDAGGDYCLECVKETGEDLENFTKLDPKADLKKLSTAVYNYEKQFKEMNPDDFRYSFLYNVIDEYKPLTQEEIRAKVKDRALPFAVFMENPAGDFNISSLLRNVNAFGGRELFYSGRKRWDKRGACGCFHYTPITYIKNNEELKDLKSEYTFIGIDNLPGSVLMEEFTNWPKKPLLLFGSEAAGLSEEALSLCEALLHIEQRGSVRSINVANASSIVLNHVMHKLK